MGMVWSQVASAVAGVMFVHGMFEKFFPGSLESYHEQLASLKRVFNFSPYVKITFPEYYNESYSRSEVYAAIQSYLSVASTARSAKSLQAHDFGPDQRSLVLTADFGELVSDSFQGAQVRWTLTRTVIPGANNWTDAERRFYRLAFRRRDTEVVTGAYMDHVVARGKEIAAKNRKKRLYSNKNNSYDNKWTSVVFRHPATFETLAMDSLKKQEIINDLVKFGNSKDYYAKIGKAWKRGYLLYGPPGTRKSSMIAAIANFLDYDVYDLELTAVKSNAELRELLISTSNKSIIVIEDTDCSLDIAGARNTTQRYEYDEYYDEYYPVEDENDDGDDNNVTTASKVTLSGLLNFIDGIWSACGSERVVVFTTNHVDKLDPALIRRGRMDKHIEMSYCRFDGFKVLAKNYLGVESHELFAKIEGLLETVDMSPADVAENLMPKSDHEDAGVCLNNLVQDLEEIKAAENQKNNEIINHVEQEDHQFYTTRTAHPYQSYYI